MPKIDCIIPVFKIKVSIINIKNLKFLILKYEMDRK